MAEILLAAPLIALGVIVSVCIDRYRVKHGKPELPRWTGWLGGGVVYVVVSTLT